MRDLLIIFIVLLVLLLIISTLGGSTTKKETFEAGAVNQISSMLKKNLLNLKNENFEALEDEMQTQVQQQTYPEPIQSIPPPQPTLPAVDPVTYPPLQQDLSAGQVSQPELVQNSVQEAFGGFEPFIGYASV